MAHDPSSSFKIGLINSIFAPLHGYRPRELAAYAACSFAFAIGTVPWLLNSDFGIPDISTLSEAHGLIVSVNPTRNAVKFRLSGRIERFSYPKKALGYDVVKSALTAAGNREVVVFFDPEPNTRLFNADVDYDVWQLDIDGKSVRTVAESQAGWRWDNAVVRWLSAWCFVSGLYLSFLARRARLVQWRL